MNTMRMTDLKPGWAVVSNDGRRLGKVKEVGQNYVRTSLSGGAKDLYVPASAIANVADGVVHLSANAADARNMGWEQAPRGDDSLETSPEEGRHRHI
jgi:hypothetical protein